MRYAAVEVTVSPEAVALAQIRARELAAELRLLGFGTRVHARQGQHQRHPCVEVRRGPGRLLRGAEYFYAAPDDLCDESGSWSFWRGADLVRPGRPDDERLGPLDDVRAAVTEATARMGFGGSALLRGEELAGAR